MPLERKDKVEKKPRVACLYRVSTKQQVNVVTDDIPVQKNACQNFASEKGWDIVIEKSEKGVSGYKVSEKKRDAIQDLKKAAENGEFDILLVFMFDRLGRIDDETPFVLADFIKKGVQVWSVVEGEQKLDSFGDKLMNYIRFLQASSESEKTSQRVREAMQQNLEQGIYSGGVVPFGYERVMKGRKKNKREDAYDLAIIKDEAEVVRMLFDKTIREGYGCHRLAMLVNSQGFKTHRDSNFQAATVSNILRNRIYTGHYSIGEKLSPIVEDLVIIDEDTFLQAQYILTQRALTNDANRTISRNTLGQTLLSGNVFCKACGKRICSTIKRNAYTLKSGEVKENCFFVYRCFYQNGEKCNCNGQKTYVAEKVDSAVISTLHEMFNMIKDKPQAVAVEDKLKAQEQNLKNQRKACDNELQKNNKRLKGLRMRIADCVIGDDKLSEEELSIAIAEVKNEIIEVESRLSEIDTELKKLSHSVSMVGKMYSDFIGWADEFDHASLAEKKMIACRLIKRVELERGYKIHIQLNMDYEQFCNEWNVG